MDEQNTYAPGWPGSPARWTSSAKSGVGTSLSHASRVWFTMSHGILNEIYYPRVDQACTRDLGLIITDGRDFFSEEKRHASSAVTYAVDGVPAYHLVNTSRDGRYRIEKDIIADPRRDVVLQQTRFTALQGRGRTIIFTFFWRRTSAITAPATPRGSATTRACPCSLRSATAMPWPWPVPRRGSSAPSALSELPMAGRTSCAISS